MANGSTNLCAPPPARCKKPISTFKIPGISTRRIPLCAPSNCEGCQPGVGEWYLNRQGTLDRTHWIEGWVATQLFSRGLALCDENPLGKRSGGWWADSFRSDNFKSGSTLWMLRWKSVSNQTLIDAKTIALDALQPLIAWGIASNIIVTPTYVTRQVMQLKIVVQGPGDSKQAIAITGQAMPDQTYLWQVVNPANMQFG